MLINNSDDLFEAVSDFATNGGTDKRKKYIQACARLYFRAQRSALKFGYVGVGCITFAEARLTELNRRLKLS